MAAAALLRPRWGRTAAAKGVYALQAVGVHRPRRIGKGCRDWLTIDERIGHSIYIYTINKARLERLRANRNTAHPFWRSGDLPPSE